MPKTRTKTKTEPITFFVEPELKQAISDVVWEEKTDVSKFLRRLCAEYIENRGEK